MSDFSATESALTGFRFVREHPRTALTWAGIALAIQIGMGVLMVAMGGPELMQLQAMQGRQPANPTAALALMGHLAPLYLLLLLFALVFYPVLYAAMNRAVLRPGEGGLTRMRLSGDELRQFLLMLLVIAVAAGALIVTAIVGGIVSLAARSAAPWASFVVLVLCCAAWIYFWVRLSLASALTFESGKVDLFGSWALTEGRFWKLLATYLLVLALAVVVGLLVLVIAVVIGAIVGGGLSATGPMFRADTSSFQAYFAPARIVMTLLWGAALGLIWPLTLMPPAEVYRQLNRSA